VLHFVLFYDVLNLLCKFSCLNLHTLTSGYNVTAALYSQMVTRNSVVIQTSCNVLRYSETFLQIKTNKMLPTSKKYIHTGRL